MITLQELKTVKEKFNRKIEGILDTKEAFDNYDRYFKWLIDKYKDETTTDQNVINELIVQKFKIILRANTFIERFGLQAKDLAKKWNKGLVARTYEDVEIQLKERNPFNDYESSLKHTLCEESILRTCDDLGTVCYCISIIQKVKPNFLSGCINYIQNGTPTTKVETTETVVTE